MKFVNKNMSKQVKPCCWLDVIFILVLERESNIGLYINCIFIFYQFILWIWHLTSVLISGTSYTKTAIWYFANIYIKWEITDAFISFCIFAVYTVSISLNWYWIQFSKIFCSHFDRLFIFCYTVRNISRNVKS